MFIALSGKVYFRVLSPECGINYDDNSIQLFTYLRAELNSQWPITKYYYYY
jgi:hypothetical protein